MGSESGKTLHLPMGVTNPYLKKPFQRVAPFSKSSDVPVSASSKEKWKDNDNESSSVHPTSTNSSSTTHIGLTLAFSPLKHHSDRCQEVKALPRSSDAQIQTFPKTGISSSLSPKIFDQRCNTCVTPTPSKIVKLSADALRKLNASQEWQSSNLKQEIERDHATFDTQSKNSNSIKSSSAKRIPTKSKATTLKSQLKCQIAALHRHKQQFIQQKEKKRQLALKEQERKRKEEELRELQKLKEQERELQRRQREKRRKAELELKLQKQKERERLQEEKIIRQQVGYHLSSLIRQVKSRIDWEKRTHVKYEIVEVMEALVHKVELAYCNSHFGDRWRMLNLGGQRASGGTVPILREDDAACHTMSSSFYGATMSYSNPHNRQPSLPSLHTLKPHQKGLKQFKPLILHADPLDQYSPFLDSHHELDDKISIFKNSSVDSFGVTLRWECRSVLVPRYHGDVTGAVAHTKKNAFYEGKVFISDESRHAKNAAVAIGSSGDESIFCSTATSLFSATNSSTISTLDQTQTSIIQTTRRKCRRRIQYGVLTVTNASKTISAESSGNLQLGCSSSLKLKSGDIILEVNGRSVGGFTFSEACRAIVSTSTVDQVTGYVQCVLKVARNHRQDNSDPPEIAIVHSVVADGKEFISLPLSNPASIPSTTDVYDSKVNARVVTSVPELLTSFTQAPPLAPLRTFTVIGNQVSKEFTPDEWKSVINSLLPIHRELSTGMALLPISYKDALLTKGEHRRFLQHRNIQELEAKLAYEGKRIKSMMKKMADKHWTSKWSIEVNNDVQNENNSLFEDPLTDGKRSTLRTLARPLIGCRCGSATHVYVNDPACVLYRDVKSFTDYSDAGSDVNRELAIHALKSIKTKSALEAAYIDRFVKLRAENEATKGEAEFVFNMELKQSLEMKKAVYSPSLFTMVLSAVASISGATADDDNARIDTSTSPELTNNADGKVNSGPIVLIRDEEDGDDTENLPLNLLVPGTSAGGAVDIAFPAAKRCKLSETDSKERLKNLPSHSILAKILRHISETWGHLHREPSHAEYAWQQRHRSVITKPLPKEVMFKGNPRHPNDRSFENLQFILDDERIIRLQKNVTSDQGLHDKWVVAYLTSDDVTGMLHEIETLEWMGLLDIRSNGSISLVSGWQKRVPHIMLIEMMDTWGVAEDMHNLYCLHDKIRSLSNSWKFVNGEGWFCSSEGISSSDDFQLVFETEEYEMRKQIFIENFSSHRNEQSGVGDFGI